VAPAGDAPAESWQERYPESPCELRGTLRRRSRNAKERHEDAAPARILIAHEHHQSIGRERCAHAPQRHATSQDFDPGAGTDALHECIDVPVAHGLHDEGDRKTAAGDPRTHDLPIAEVS
jgi:hypothetical protein